MANEKKVPVLGFWKKLFTLAVSVEEYKKLQAKYDADIKTKDNVLAKQVEANNKLAQDKINLEGLRVEDADKIKTLSTRVTELDGILAKKDEKHSALVNENNVLKDRVSKLEEDVEFLTTPVASEVVAETCVDSCVETPVVTPEPVAVTRKNNAFTKKEVKSIFVKDSNGVDAAVIALELGSSVETVQRVLVGETYTRYGFYAQYKK